MISRYRRRNKRPRPKRKRKEKRLQHLADSIDTSPYTHIIGIDEVGWGALAGPITVGGVLLPMDATPVIKDSKRYSTDRARRRAWDKVVQDYPDIAVALVNIHPDEIDEFGYAAALKKATLRVAEILMFRSYDLSTLIVMDGNNSYEFDNPSIAIPRADDFVAAVSAASVFAKLNRDEYMRYYKDLDEWEFFKHKGYGTQFHIKMIKKQGPIPGIHRRKAVSGFIT